MPALGVTALAMAVFAYAAPVVSPSTTVTGLHSVAWHRSIQPMVLALAVLAGVGMDAVVRAGADGGCRAAGRRAASARLGLIVLALWLFGRGTLPPAEAAIRARSFVWPVVELVVGLAVCAVLFGRRAAPGEHGAAAMAGAAAEGDGAGTGPVVGGRRPARHRDRLPGGGGGTPGVVEPDLHHPHAGRSGAARTVGTRWWPSGPATATCRPRSGCTRTSTSSTACASWPTGTPWCPRTPSAPWPAATGTHAGAIGAPLILCPAMSSATTARQYGVGYILEQPGATPPAGTTRVTTLAGEGLYRVPGSGLVTLAPAPSGNHTSASTPADDTGVPQATTSPDPNIVRVDVHAAGASVMDIHVTDVPGWHATLDGRPLRLTPLEGTMLQARIPAGHHTVELHYWPTAFTAGLIVGLVAVLALAGAVAVEGMRRRRPPVLGRR